MPIPKNVADSAKRALEFAKKIAAGENPELETGQPAGYDRQEATEFKQALADMATRIAVEYHHTFSRRANEVRIIKTGASRQVDEHELTIDQSQEVAGLGGQKINTKLARHIHTHQQRQPGDGDAELCLV